MDATQPLKWWTREQCTDHIRDQQVRGEIAMRKRRYKPLFLACRWCGRRGDLAGPGYCYDCEDKVIAGAPPKDKR